jgi:hypothetical protein
MFFSLLPDSGFIRRALGMTSMHVVLAGLPAVAFDAKLGLWGMLRTTAISSLACTNLHTVNARPSACQRSLAEVRDLTRCGLPSLAKSSFSCEGVRCFPSFALGFRGGMIFRAPGDTS